MRIPGRQHAKQAAGGGGGAIKGTFGRLLTGVVVLLICSISFLVMTTTNGGGGRSGFGSEINLDELLRSADSGGWRPSSTPRSDWPSPPSETNGYLRVL